MTKSYAIIALIILSGIVATVLVSFNPVSPTGTVEDEYKTSNPEKNYTDYCAGCHGEKMDAFVDRAWKHGNSENDLFKAIKYGYPDEGMPGYDTTFTDDETKELVDYVITGIKNVKKYDFKDPARSNIFKSESITVKLDTILKGVDVPWGMAFLPGGDMLVTERSGKIYRVGPDKKVQMIEGVPEVVNEGQGGLMDIILHPKVTIQADINIFE